MLRDRSIQRLDRNTPGEVTVTIDEPYPTREEIRLLATKPLPRGLLAADNCGKGSMEYKLYDPVVTWKTFPVRYAFETSVNQDMRNGIIKSFDIYNELKPGFFEHGILTDAKLKVSMDNLGGTNGTLARASWSYSTSTFAVTKATITFDSSDKWAWLTNESCGSTGSTYDIGNVAVHEIGHTCGLAHAPTDPLQTMYASTSPGKTLGRTFGNGDEAGLRKLYNIIVTPTPPQPTELEEITSQMRTLVADFNKAINLQFDELEELST